MMDVDKEKIEDLIARYFTEELSNQELEKLHCWIGESDENEKYFYRLQEIWFATANRSNTTLFDKEKAYRRFRVRTKLTENEIVLKKRRIFFVAMRRIAAVILLLVSFGGAGYWLASNFIGEQYTDIFVEAPFGSKTKLYLPDGTLVWLNAGSNIEYSQAFGIKDRKLILNGEAYFEVTKNEGKAFEVTANGMTVRVLGTKFNFRNYFDEDEARVTLLEGKVSVKNGENGKEIQLVPNQQAAYDKKSFTTKVLDVKAARASEWTKGIIFFDEERLFDIARELERLYNVQITIADDALNNYRFYGNFFRTEQSIQEVLDVLASTEKLTYTINGKNITLSQ